MDFHWVWKAILIVLAGSIILRIAGRKSISQLTVSQTVIMISIGNLMIQPVSDRNIWITFLIALLLVLVLIMLEYIQTKYNKFENFITGKAILIIDNGTILEHNLKKLRLTVDQLEVRLRQVNVKRFSDVQFATIEPSGQIGFVLKEHTQAATKQDLQILINYLHSKLPGDQIPPPLFTEPKLEVNELFIEVKEKGGDQPNNEDLK
ncbi:hypothetical protein BKP45_00560 [Anaerobacillus alkalidiazotrophicus]|uniref:YetF C-terminal domain-containing protein n=1 Tax=Anaerobacillus alkalidiazotrophicus TaxID=472963 RepID=A0A1S2M9A3_9BACI|nr:YetF domain-containing protein [Anaerobacillus alkalidiazotrophicus]OIJ21308.1 hypothetical protein BKP45_00560 [Anaerobacillus alkalidiazotrophicus]